jgi:hypothetical protein
MNDGTNEPDYTRPSSAIAALSVPALLLLAALSSLNRASSATHLDPGAISSHMTWGAGGLAGATAALVLPFVVLAAPLGGRDE